MLNNEKYTKVLQWHLGIENFDYDLSIDWAINLMKNGIESENVLIISSFSKPVNSEEIQPYITAALKELNLEEKYGEYSIIANTHYYLDQILNNEQIRKNLEQIYKLCLQSDFEKGLMPFYLLYHSWDGLEELGENNYFPGAELNNIEDLIKEEAIKWIDKYIYKKEDEIKKEEVSKTIVPLKKHVKEKSFWNWIKKPWTNNKNGL